MTDTPTATRWVVMTPLDDVVPALENPKDHADGLLDTSLDTFGYVEPMLCDGRTGRLVAGHGRLDSLRRAETADPQDPPEGVALADDGRWLIPVVHGWSSTDDAQARDYLLVSNRASEVGGWRPRPLAEFLADMDARAGDLRSAMWDDDSYRDLVVDSGLAADRATDFLDDVDPGDGPTQGAASGTRQTTDVVDLRLPMPDRERDEAIALLRQHQRVLQEAGQPAATLPETALTVLRTWTVAAT